MFKKKPKAHKVTGLAEIVELTKSGKPVLIDFYQTSCAPCQVMDGIFNELAREYGTSAHVVKADIANMPDAVQQFKIQSTPTLVLLTSAGSNSKDRSDRQRQITQRWRAAGLVKKDQLTGLLESNGAVRVPA